MGTLIQALWERVQGVLQAVDVRADQYGNLAVGGLRQLWRDDFSGAAIDPLKWASSVDPGMALAVGTSLVTVTPNAAAGYVGETVLVGKRRMTAPVRAVLGLKTAAVRVVGQYVLFEFVAVNSDGSLDENNRISFGNQVSTATATSWTYTTVSDGEEATANVASLASLTAAPGALAEIVVDNEEITVATGLIASGRSIGGVSLQTNLPDPLREYVVRIRIGTDATYAGGGAAVVLYHVLALDYAEVSAEITGGRGVSPASQSLPVAAQGPVAAGATATGVNPTLAGVLARSSNPTALSNNQGSYLFGDLAGRGVMQLGGIPQLQDANRQVLAGSAETTLVSAVASVRHVLHTIAVANLNNTNPVQLDFRDSLAGSIRFTLNLRAGESLLLPMADGWAAVGTNTAWTVQATGTSPSVSVAGKSFRLPY